MTCPYRKELSLGDMPEYVKRLPVDARGYPVPFFVDWLPDGTPEFRAMDPAKIRRCLKEQRCWVCGEPLHSTFGFRATLAFVIGPMCAVNRISSEPPSHVPCAEWSARNCPFLARPHMVRREDDEINAALHHEQERGLPILRNPGVALVWKTDGFQVLPQPKGMLFKVNAPTSPVTWWAEGRPATRAEILHSIDTGLPLLESAIEMERPEDRPAASSALKSMLAAAMKLVPAEAHSVAEGSQR
jgi:hypothetical protein